MSGTSYKNTLKAELEDIVGGTPKLYVQIIDAYNSMLSDSVYDEDSETFIWSGKLTTFLEDAADISQSQYSRVMGTLTAMQCVVQLRRGTGTIDSKWAVLGPPTYRNYEFFRKQAGYRREKRVDPRDQMIKNLGRELMYINARIDRILDKLDYRETKEEIDQLYFTVDTQINKALDNEE